MGCERFGPDSNVKKTALQPISLARPSSRGRVPPSETFKNREEVRPGTGREAGLGRVFEEHIGTYLLRVSEGGTRLLMRDPGTRVKPEWTGLPRDFVPFCRGFAASWVYLLRHAVNTSMWAHPKHPCFVRSKEVHPTPGELCEIETAVR